MMHRMKLNPEPFRKIQNGTKTIELRLFDEKRRQVKPGDYIEFSNTEHPEERIQTRVTVLHRFRSFAELYDALPLLQCGYTEETIADAAPGDMETYYPKDEQLQYGVVGIELRMTDLQKFLDAQNDGYQFGSDYPTALAEVRNGEKQSHWMWYIFPQIQGLGRSGTTAYFSIHDLSEAQDYYQHPILGTRLVEIARALLTLATDDPMAVFGVPDAYKLRSCMTLFREAAPEEPIFQQVLEKFCLGTPDENTMTILKSL